MAVLKLIDAVNIIAEQANDPLVRAVVGLAVLIHLVVIDLVAVLPLVCLFQGKLQANFLLCSSGRAKDEVYLPSFDAFEEFLFHCGVCLASF